MPPYPLNTSPNIQAEKSGKWAKNFLIFTVNLQLGVPNIFTPSLIAIFKPFLQGVLKMFHQTFTFAGIYISA